MTKRDPEVEIRALDDFRIPGEPLFEKGKVRFVPQSQAEQFVEQGFARLVEHRSSKQAPEPEAGKASGQDASSKE